MKRGTDAIDDVVMHERRQMNQLGRGTDSDGIISLRARSWALKTTMAGRKRLPPAWMM